MAANAHFKFNDVRGRAERSGDVTGRFFNQCGFAQQPGGRSREEFARCCQRIKAWRRRVDVATHPVGGVLGSVDRLGEDDRNRLTDITHMAARQYPLAIRLQTRHRGQPHIDWWHIGDIGCGPHRHHPRRCGRCARIDRHDASAGYR